jgi:hypothetical protein
MTLGRPTRNHRHAPRAVLAAVALAAALGLGLSLPGCSSGPPRARAGEAPAPEPFVRAAVGDIGPAIRGSVGRHGLAILTDTPIKGGGDGPDEGMRYELVSIRDEPSWLEARYDTTLTSPRLRTEVRLDAEIGFFDDPERAAALIVTIQRRLEQLREAGGIAPWPEEGDPKPVDD